MSMVKRMMEERERLNDVAAEILIETGAIKRCEIHEEVLIDQMDEDAVKHAYALATQRLKSGPIEGDREQLMDAIKHVASDSAMECYSCARHREDD